MRDAAFRTLGQYLFLTDHSGVGNPHAKPQAPRYNIERLNQLMVRMIASELAGKPVLPQEIIATKPAGWTTPPVPQQHMSPCILPTPTTASVSIPSMLGKFLQWAGVLAALLLLVVIDTRFCT